MNSETLKDLLQKASSLKQELVERNSSAHNVEYHSSDQGDYDVFMYGYSGLAPRLLTSIVAPRRFLKFIEASEEKLKIALLR